MKKNILGLFMLITAINCFQLIAQNKPKKAFNVPIGDTAKKSKTIRILKPNVYLGNSTFCGGKIKKAVYDSLAKFKLYANDSFGNEYKVIGFNFTYAEHNLYEDSAASLIIVTDYNFEYCPGDTLTDNIKETLFKRTKFGDTIMMEKIRLVKYLKATQTYANDTDAIYGKDFRCIIVK